MLLVVLVALEAFEHVVGLVPSGLHQRVRFGRKQSAGVRQPHFPGTLGGLFFDVVHVLPHYSARNLKMPLDGAPRAGKMPRLRAVTLGMETAHRRLTYYTYSQSPPSQENRRWR